MEKLPIIFLAIALLFLLSVSPVIAQEKRVFYHITIKEKGDADFTIRYIIPLTTKEELDSFKLIIEDFNETIYLNDFMSRMSDLVDRASLQTGREMQGMNYSVKIYLIEGVSPYGAISYSFLWKNFGKIEGDKLIIGDVFEGGMYLFRDDSLTVYIPDDYSPETIIPSPDEIEDGAITWYGPKNFGNGEPTLILVPVTAIEKEKLGADVIYLVAGAGLFLLLMVVSYWKIKKLKKERGDREFDVKTDEEIIIDLLRKRGAMLQSDIVKATGFSKSKVSNLIAVLRKKGLVEKVKIGRENMIRIKEDGS
jgi:uncharacterized membrane protein